MISKFVKWLEPYPRLYTPARSIYRRWRQARFSLAHRRARRVARDFHRLFYHGPGDEGGVWYSVNWLGIPAQKCPLDLCIYQEILFETRPDLIVECGVNFGGSTLFLATICDALNTGHLLACDITLDRVHDEVRRHPRIELVEASSTSDEFYELVRRRAAGRRVMVILDSDHSRAHVLMELRRFGALVSPGCYLVCEDTNINGHPVYPAHGPGPSEALDEYLRECAGDWTIDRHRERLLVTFNPGGYLRRNMPAPSLPQVDGRSDPLLAAG
jgi:cephalosporin hydroxylase